MFELYTDSSQNGFKATIALEELNLDYHLNHIQISRGDHQQSAFLQLNPYGRIPVLHDPQADITLFESAAILLYLAEKTGKLLPNTPKQKWEAIKWLQFHSASLGPIIGQWVNFAIFDKSTKPEVVERYFTMTHKAFKVLDQQLQNNAFIAGDSYTIADIANFSWLHIAEVIDFDFSQHAHLFEWYQRIAARPAVRKGIALPAPATEA